MDRDRTLPTVLSLCLATGAVGIAGQVMCLGPSTHRAFVVLIILQGLLHNCLEGSLSANSWSIRAMAFWLFLVTAARLLFLLSQGQTDGVAPEIAMVGGRGEYHAR